MILSPERNIFQHGESYFKISSSREILEVEYKIILSPNNSYLYTLPSIRTILILILIFWFHFTFSWIKYSCKNEVIYKVSCYSIIPKLLPLKLFIDRWRWNIFIWEAWFFLSFCHYISKTVPCIYRIAKSDSQFIWPDIHRFLSKIMLTIIILLMHKIMHIYQVPCEYI
jgi:hypothetical protein